MSDTKFERELFVIENKRNDDLFGLPANYVKMHWDWRPLFYSNFLGEMKRKFSTLKSVPGDEYRLARYIPDG